MSNVYKVFAGVGLLIGAYLFLNNYKGTVEIIQTIGTQGVAGVKTLQGRG